MKVTIDVPAPTQTLELVSRLRQKVRNYKTSMKQLQRAHFITKTLWERQKEREIEQQYMIRQQDRTIRHLENRIENLETAYDELLAMQGTVAREAPPLEPRNEAEGEVMVFCDNEACAIVHTHKGYPVLEAPEDSYEEVPVTNGAAHGGNGNGVHGGI